MTGTLPRKRRGGLRFAMTPTEVLQVIKEKGVAIVDLKFMDLLGQWQHFSVPISEFSDESAFEDGLGFDGSSIRGWQGIHVSDMLAVPMAPTARIDPFYKEPTVSVIADVRDPVTGKEYSRDPRFVARKATEHLKRTRLADAC